MPATPRSTESTAVSGTTFKLAFELGSTKWTLGFRRLPPSARVCGRSPLGIWFGGGATIKQRTLVNALEIADAKVLDAFELR